MMKKLLVFCFILLLCMASLPALAQTAASPEEKAALLAYQAVVLDNAPFMSVSDGMEITLEQLSGMFEEESMLFPRFALVDMDADGVSELVLWETLNEELDYGYEVLHYQNGVVYGYDFVYRALLELKEDGTYSYSSGAADNGIGFANFSQDGGYIEGELAGCQSDFDASGNMIVSFFVNGAPATESEFNAAVDAQNAKPNAEWRELTDESIQALTAE